MRVIRQLEIPKLVNADFADGTIVNETPTTPGTPVVEEIYGDVLTNIYAILKDAGVTPSGTRDSVSSGFQLLQAFKLFVNSLNDVEQILSLNGTDWSVAINIDNLPDRYVFVGRAAEAFTGGVDYTFSGAGNDTLLFTSPTGFNASDELLVVIDQSGVRAYSLTASTSAMLDEGFPVFGFPIAFSDTNKIYYESAGSLITDLPSVANIQQRIRTFAGNGTLYINETFILQNKVLCVCFDTAAVTYQLFQLDLASLTTVQQLTINGNSIPVGVDNTPYFFTDGNKVYITNQSGNSVDDFKLDSYLYNPTTATLDFVQALNLESSYLKTTNTVIRDTQLFTFATNDLVVFSLTSGAATPLGNYPVFSGQIFKYNGNIFYTNGAVAKKWTL